MAGALKFILNDTLHCGYFPIQKCGCSPIKDQLLRWRGITPGDDVHHGHHWVDYDPIQHRDLFTFAFVRNPFDRLVSCWADKCIKGDPTGSIYGPFGALGMTLGIPFAEFVDRAFEVPDEQADSHYQSQVSSICNDAGKFVPKFIGRFEQLQDGWNRVCDWIRAKRSPLRVVGKVPHAPWQEHYTTEIQRKVLKRYDQDFDILAYPPDFR